MGRDSKQPEVLRAWTQVPQRIRRSIAGLAAQDLDLRGGSEGWSIRESVHHLVEANLVLSNMVLAALGKPGHGFDWSWVMPDATWMKRLGYDRAPVDPALALLEALGAHVAEIVSAAPRALDRHVKLQDAPGDRPYRKTVAQLLQDEVEHARHHLDDVAAIRKAHRAAGRRAAAAG